MNYTVHLGNSRCSQCNKAIKKIYIINGQHYGSECARNFLGDSVLDSAPPWALQVAEDYVRYRFQQAAAGVDKIEGPEDFTVNFFNDSDAAGNTPWGCRLTRVTNRDGSSRAWWEPISINGKSVKPEWQTEMAKYMVQLRAQLLGQQQN